MTETIPQKIRKVELSLKKANRFYKSCRLHYLNKDKSDKDYDMFLFFIKDASDKLNALKSYT